MFAQIIFRIRAKEHNPECPQPVSGVSDHPDRGPGGQWLDYPPGSMDPFERSKHLLCHPWEVVSVPAQATSQPCLVV